MKPQKISRHGAKMDVGKNKWATLCLFVLILWSIVLLNYSPLYFEDQANWVRFGLPILMLAGLLGSIYSWRALRIAGWVSVCLFALVELGAVIPGEDYTLGGPGSPSGPAPHIIPNGILFRRLLLLGGSALSLIICFYLAGRSNAPKSINDSSETH
jgi:hypothetical protein